MREQVLARILGVDEPGPSLVLPCALHLDQADGADVGPGRGIVAAGFALQLLAELDRLEQRVLPVHARAAADVEVQFDHFLRVEFASANVHEHVGALRRGGGEFNDQARVETCERPARSGAVRPVSLVEDDHRLLKAEHVPEGGLRVAAQRTDAAVERVEIRHPVEEPMVFGVVVLGREESFEAAAVPEHAELLLGFPIRGRQHQQQDAQPFREVAGSETRRLLQDHCPAGGREVELLPVGMVEVPERPERLVVNLGRRNNPQHESGLLLPEVEVDEVDHLRREEGFSAAGRDLETERRQGSAEAVLARRPGPEGDGLLPGGARPVVAELRGDVTRLFAELCEPLEVVQHGRQRALLVLLEDHVSNLATVW